MQSPLFCYSDMAPLKAEQGNCSPGWVIWKQQWHKLFKSRAEDDWYKLGHFLESSGHLTSFTELRYGYTHFKERGI